MKLPDAFADLAHLPENDRIGVIGHLVSERQTVIGVALEDDKGKVDRYVKKLLTRFPHLVVISRDPGLVPDTIMLRVGPRP